MNLDLYRPQPWLHYDAQPVDLDGTPRQAAQQLLAGETLILKGGYSDGLEILEQLRVQLRPPPQSAPFASRRAFQAALREASHRLLAPIFRHRIDLQGAPFSGFLEQLYPDLRRFALPFPMAQELALAWKWYDRGVSLAVLGRTVHPFFGTYAPARTTHLELFGTFLSQYKGPRHSAIDVGTGCGVLAMQLCKAGFERVLATDTNPNAIESVGRELARMASPMPIDLELGDLLGRGERQVDMVVFNPPWIQGEINSPLDQALYYEPGLFERFFEQARARVAPHGRVVLVFSNIIELVQPEVEHPILAELERGRFELASKLRRKVKASAGHRRTKERVEIWELTPV